MLRQQTHRIGQGLLPLFHGLPRQPVNEVQADIFEACLPGGRHGVLGLLPGVDAADGPQRLVVRGLYSQGDAVKACPAQALQSLFVPGGVGIGLQGNLRVLIHLIELFDAPQQVAQAVCSQIAGGTAAKVDGVHQMAGCLGRHLDQMPLQGAAIVVHKFFAA